MKDLIRRLGEIINSYQGYSFLDRLYYLLAKIVYKL